MSCSKYMLSIMPCHCLFEDVANLILSLNKAQWSKVLLKEEHSCVYILMLSRPKKSKGDGPKYWQQNVRGVAQ